VSDQNDFKVVWKSYKCLNYRGVD